MTPLSYFDCHASYGPRPKLHPHERWSLEHLLEDLDAAGTSRALVTHAQALLSDPLAANRRLLREIRSQRLRLVPTWVVYPPAAGEFPSPSELVRMLRGEFVRAVRIEPALFGIPPEAPGWAELAERLAGEGVLVCASWSGLGGAFEMARRYLAHFLYNETLLLDLNWAQWRTAHYLMAAFPKLRLDLSSFQANRAVEDFCVKYGATRLCYGSGLPHKAAGAARAFIDLARLSRPELELLAGRNLANLLGQPLAPVPPVPADPLVRAVTLGRPLPTPVYDAHCHVLPDGVTTGGQTYVMPWGDADGVLALATSLGIRRTAVMSWEGPVCMDAREGNRTVEAALRQQPDKWWGLVSVNPESMSPREMASLVRRKARAGWVGVKPYAVRNLVDYDDPAYLPCFAVAEKEGMYLLLHVDKMKAVDAVAGRHPRLNILIAHTGQSWAFAREAVALMKRHPRVYAELTYTSVTNGVIEYLVRELGEGRVLFGSDAPMRDPRPQLGWVIFSRIPFSAKKKLLGGNFCELLGARARRKTIRK